MTMAIYLLVKKYPCYSSEIIRKSSMMTLTNVLDMHLGIRAMTLLLGPVETTGDDDEEVVADIKDKSKLIEAALAFGENKSMAAFKKSLDTHGALLLKKDELALLQDITQRYLKETRTGGATCLDSTTI